MLNNMNTDSLERLVLVVDDNRDAARLLGRLLELNGYTVHLCHDGPSGLAAAQRLRPSAIILDLAMPEMDGYAVCRSLRAWGWGEQPLVVAQSGYSSGADLQRSKEAGFDAHLSKPVDFAALLSLLAEQITK